MLNLKSYFPVLLTAGLGLGLLSCGGGSETETVVVPTQGLITTVTEVSEDNYKIASEVPVDRVEDSRIIVEEMSGERDTFTLEQAKLMEQIGDPDSTEGRPFRSAGLGYWGFLMLGRMGGTPSMGAYASPAAHQQATNTAGSRMRSTARTTTRTRSGFGAGRSTRSFGG